MRKESNSIKNEVISAIQTKGETVQFEKEDMKLEGKLMEKESKPTWKGVREEKDSRTLQQKGNAKWNIQKTK